jgi:hypothetical protein
MLIEYCGQDKERTKSVHDFHHIQAKGKRNGIIYKILEYLKIKTHLFTTEKYISILGVKNMLKYTGDMFSRGKCYIRI